ncbi:MAG: hypothetical protein ACT4O0_16035 [Pseudonocardia sp.]|jgi:hypothetical protein
MTGLLILALMTALTGLLAACFGADSRDGQDWRRGTWGPPHHPPRPAGPTRASRAEPGERRGLGLDLPEYSR